MTIKEFRVALAVEDFEQAVAFYHDGLGLDPGELWTENGSLNVRLRSPGGLQITLFQEQTNVESQQHKEGNG